MWYNPIITWLLRSPLHGLVSGMYALITFVGQKSGRTYTTPVQYKQFGQTLKFVTRRSRVWWKNLRGGAPVTVRLRGQDQPGRAEEAPADDAAALAAEILTVYAPVVSAAAAAQMAPESVVIHIALTPRPPAAPGTGGPTR